MTRLAILLLAAALACLPGADLALGATQTATPPPPSAKTRPSPPSATATKRPKPSPAPPLKERNAGSKSAAGSAASQPGDETRIKQSLSAEEARAAEGRKAIKRLGEQEQTLGSKLTGIEGRVKELEQATQEAEKGLAALRAEEARAARTVEELERDRERQISELGTLLTRLWPVQLQASKGMREESGGWSESDRTYTWLSSLFLLARDRLDQIQARAETLKTALIERERKTQEAARQLSKVNEAKDKLLAERLSQRKQLASIRARMQEEEEELGDILATIGKLNYQLKSLTDRDFDHLKGSLPWPAKGKVVVRFRPESTPPRRGLGLALKEGQEVTAVAWGRVVHDDVLRGFGRVVIILHGKDYYTLYANLSSSTVKVGQEVDRGAVIGAAGVYPDAGGPGLYFELRFRQKAINPEFWLIALQ